MKASKSIFSVIALMIVVILSFFVFPLLQSSKSSSDQSYDAQNKKEVGSTPEAQQQINNQTPLSTNLPTEFSERFVLTDSNPEEGTEKKVDPVVMTDYKNLTIIANDIDTYEDQSFATGNVGVVDRHGMIAVANEGIITHTNQSGSIDSVYLPGESSIELFGDITMSSTETEIIQNSDGSKKIISEKLILDDSFDFSNAVITTGGVSITTEK